MDLPLQDGFNSGNASPGWQTHQDSSIFDVPDAIAQESWNEFMSWDPEAPQADIEGPLQSHMEDNMDRGDFRMARAPLNSDLRAQDGSEVADEAALSFAFGDGSTSFGFDLNEPLYHTHGQDVHLADRARPQLDVLAHPMGTGSTNLSPLDVTSQGMSGNTMSGSSVSSRASLGHSPHSSPDPHGTPPSSNGSPESQKLNDRKRKSSDFSSGPQGQAKRGAKQPPVKKTTHNMIEKRYRNKLNDKIEELKNSVPSLKKLSSVGMADDDNEDDLDGLTPAHKTNKATVLSKATEYIKHLEKRNKQLQDDLQSLKVEMEKLRKFAMSATMQFSNGRATPDSPGYPDDSFAGGATSNTTKSALAPQGMIPVPESMMNLHGSTAGQGHYAHQYTSQPDASRARAAQQPMVRMRGGQPFNKMMVGALAGLMILEGLSEREESGDKPEGRGLFALPVRLLNPSSSSLLHYSGSTGGALDFLPLAKALVLIGALVYLIAPLLSMKPKPKQKLVPAVRLTTVPPLASPIEVRQKAWLTAIQTVWVPQHNFFSELAALAIKVVKLGTRRIIGWGAYAMLTGTTKEQEQARVSAWRIAIDAQLTGGDAEINISRLLLTILASGTLPDTPASLMLKAMHIRVLLWQFVKAGYGNWFIFDDLCARLARKYWDAARFEHQLNINSGSRFKHKESTDPGAEVEPLPDHLAALLQIPCDDVLTDSIIQRAYNLAWNRTSDPDDIMDVVVEDFGISNPLDALAAWFSCHLTKKALSSSLASPSTNSPTKLVKEIDLAVRVAPPSSTAHIRALVARAVLSHADRNAHIAAAMRALPLRADPAAAAILANEVAAAPLTHDVKLALTLAKCLALLDSDARGTLASAARARAVAAVAASPFAGARWTLLSFAAGYKVMNALAADGVGVRSDILVQRGVERLAGSLRLWIGRNEGEKLALGKTRGRVVERCLVVRKEVSEGKDDEERESGYGSLED